MMDKPYKPIDCAFHDYLEIAALHKEYVKIQFLTEIREFYTAMAVINGIVTKKGEEFIVLSTGEKIRLDRIVRLNKRTFPGYETYEDYSCDC